MFIRTQQKDCIRDISNNDVYAYRYIGNAMNKKHEVMKFTEDNPMFAIKTNKDEYLGVYETEEEAMEVIDMIWQSMCSGARCFQMPYGIGSDFL